MKKHLILTALILTLCASNILAADFKVDTEHSQVLFKIKHLGISTVSGRFDDFEGSYSFDPEKIMDSTAEFSLQVESINTNSPKRDGHLKSADFFDTATYPTLTFKSHKISDSKDDHFKLQGDLTMHGVTQPVVFDVSYQGADDSWGKHRTAFTASAVINRFDYGLEFNKLTEAGSLVVGKEVTITLEIEGVQ